jgi:hypothetical protein
MEPDSLVIPIAILETHWRCVADEMNLVAALRQFQPQLSADHSAAAI